MVTRTLRYAQSLLRHARDPLAFHRAQGVRIGKGCDLISTRLTTFGSEPYLVTLGNGVTVSHGVDFITHDGGLRVIRDRFPAAYYYAPIAVGDNAFIGAHAVLLPGSSVGAGSVIGAGSVVTGPIPDGVVAAGVPAKVISSTEDYGLKRRDAWIDTGGLSADAKEQLLRRRFGL